MTAITTQNLEQLGSARIPEFRGLDQHLVQQAILIRRTEERLLELFAEGKLFGTVHTCIGQEWAAVAVCHALQKGDYLFSNHRGHGHYLAWTDDVDGLVAELMGRSSGVCGGRGGSQHLCRDGFFSNGVQGGIVPPAAGLAMAQNLAGTEGMAAVFIGDGTLGEGAVYETLNMAARWDLPLLVVVEDNGISQSTRQYETLAGSIAGRAAAFGIGTRTGDTWHPQTLIATAQAAARIVRTERRPLLLHIETCRLKAHSKGDDNRELAEIQEMIDRDLLSQLLIQPDPGIAEMVAAADRRLDAAVERALQASYAQAGSRHSTTPAPEIHTADAPGWQPVRFEPQRIADAIRSALSEAMEVDPRLVLLGEDIRDSYGGAFKVTAGLSTRFSERVRNTPISEAAIVGISNGLALAGWHPVAEIMFGDFLLLASDQIVNHAAKFSWMYNDRVRVPMVIRTPMGGYRGYGPTHSQSLEKHLLGLPGTRVLALHRRYCPAELYRRLLADIDRPTLVIENKLLYGKRSDPEPPAGCTLMMTADAYPTICLSPDGPADVTIVAYGGMLDLAESAMAILGEREEIAVELLAPTQLYPLNLEPILQSVQKTRRLLVVEEGQRFCGFGSEVITQLAADRRTGAFRVDRICADETPIPAAKPAEQAVLPSVDEIVQAVLALLS